MNKQTIAILKHKTNNKYNITNKKHQTQHFQQHKTQSNQPQLANIKA